MHLRLSFIRRLPTACAALLAALALGCGSTPETERPTVCLTEVRPTGLGFASGLRPGDRLVRWDGSGGGPIHSIFQAREVESVRAPAGGGGLTVERRGRRLRIPVRSGSWQVKLAPCGSRALRDADERARAALATQPETAAEIWQSLAQSPDPHLTDGERLGFRFQAAAALAAAGQSSTAAETFDALRDDLAILDRHSTAIALELEGEAWQKAGETERALGAITHALELRRELGPESIGVASALQRLASATPETEGALRHLAAARELLERLDIGEHERAQIWNSMGRRAFGARQLGEAERFFRAGLELLERSMPESPKTATAHYNLALVVRRLGRLDEAESHIRNALPNYPESAPRTSPAYTTAWP